MWTETRKEAVNVESCGDVIEQVTDAVPTLDCTGTRMEIIALEELETWPLEGVAVVAWSHVIA